MTETNRTAIALLSSGLDSSVALAMALQDGWQVSLALTLDYGQRAATSERAHAARIAAHFGVPHQSLELGWFRGFSGGGALLRGGEPLPEPKLGQLSEGPYTQASAKAVWVPNRNGVLIEIAAGFAEDRCATAVIVGFNAEEAQTFPDNSVPYLNAITKALAFSTANQVRVVSPTSNFEKHEIVAVARALGFPFELLWSCYRTGEKMCGRCESCMRLKRALKRNEVPFDAFFADTNLEG